MYAIVDIAGQQFKVEKDQKLFVHRLEGEEGKKVSFEKVLLIDTGNKIAVGDPIVQGASVAAKIVAHVKGDKVLVFKKKRRKGYKKLNGHRQYLTQIQIETISEKAGSKNAEGAKPADTKATADKKSSAVKSEVEPGTKTSEKPAAKTTAKKPAAKSTAKKPAAKTSAKKPETKAAARPPTKKESGDDNATTE